MKEMSLHLDGKRISILVQFDSESRHAQAPAQQGQENHAEVAEEHDGKILKEFVGRMERMSRQHKMRPESLLLPGYHQMSKKKRNALLGRIVEVLRQNQKAG
jgi:hypothetical protein